MLLIINMKYNYETTGNFHHFLYSISGKNCTNFKPLFWLYHLIFTIFHISTLGWVGQARFATSKIGSNTWWANDLLINKILKERSNPWFHPSLKTYQIILTRMKNMDPLGNLAQTQYHKIEINVIIHNITPCLERKWDLFQNKNPWGTHIIIEDANVQVILKTNMLVSLVTSWFKYT